jgi:hypothetical protein
MPRTTTLLQEQPRQMPTMLKAQYQGPVDCGMCVGACTQLPCFQRQERSWAGLGSNYSTE